MISMIAAWAVLWALYFIAGAIVYRAITGNPSLYLTPEEAIQKQMVERKPVTVRQLKKSLMKMALPHMLMRGVYLGVALGTVYGVLATLAPTFLRLPNLVEVDYNRFLVLDQDKIQKFSVSADAVPLARVDGMPELPGIPQELRPQATGNMQQRAETMADKAGFGAAAEDLNAKTLREALQRQLPKEGEEQ